MADTKKLLKRMEKWRTEGNKILSQVNSPLLEDNVAIAILQIEKGIRYLKSCLEEQDIRQNKLL